MKLILRTVEFIHTDLNGKTESAKSCRTCKNHAYGKEGVVCSLQWNVEDLWQGRADYEDFSSWCDAYKPNSRGWKKL